MQSRKNSWANEQKPRKRNDYCRSQAIRVDKPRGNRAHTASAVQVKAEGGCPSSHLALCADVPVDVCGQPGMNPHVSVGRSDSCNKRIASQISPPPTSLFPPATLRSLKRNQNRQKRNEARSEVRRRIGAPNVELRTNGPLPSARQTARHACTSGFRITARKRACSKARATFAGKGGGRCPTSIFFIFLPFSVRFFVNSRPIFFTCLFLAPRRTRLAALVYA